MASDHRRLSAKHHPEDPMPLDVGVELLQERFVVSTIVRLGCAFQGFDVLLRHRLCSISALTARPKPLGPALPLFACSGSENYLRGAHRDRVKQIMQGQAEGLLVFALWRKHDHPASRCRSSPVDRDDL